MAVYGKCCCAALTETISKNNLWLRVNLRTQIHCTFVFRFYLQTISLIHDHGISFQVDVLIFEAVNPDPAPFGDDSDVEAMFTLNYHKLPFDSLTSLWKLNENGPSVDDLVMKHGDVPVRSIRRTFRSQTSNSINRWQSRGWMSRKREEDKKEDQRKERVKGKKMQVREKVEKSRFTEFFQ